MASLTCVIHGNAKVEEKRQGAGERAVGWDGWAELVGLTGLTGLTMVIRKGIEFGFIFKKADAYRRIYPDG